MASSGLNASLASSSSLAIAGRRIRPAVSGAVVAVRLFQKSRATTTSIRFGSSSSSANNSNNNSNTNNPDNTAGADPAAAEPSSSSSAAKDDPSSSSSSSQQQSQPQSQPPQQPVKTIFNWRTMAEEEVSSYLKQNHDRLFHNNQKWADDKVARNPEFFSQLSAGQSPEYLWIGCSDSRIPAEQIVGLEPGEAFIHRNIANLVINTDLNVMGVINYAVKHLGVKHIIICGHYGCGGVKAAMTPKDLGILNPWLRNIRDIYRLHEKELDAIGDDTERYNRLVELNVIEQCRNVIKTSDVQQSYAQNGYPIVHGWVFGFSDGLLKDLKIDFESVLEDIQKIYNLTN